MRGDLRGGPCRVNRRKDERPTPRDAGRNHAKAPLAPAAAAVVVPMMAPMPAAAPHFLGGGNAVGGGREPAPSDSGMAEAN